MCREGSPPLEVSLSRKNNFHWVYKKAAEGVEGVAKCLVPDRDRLSLWKQLDICSYNPNTPTDASLATEGENECERGRERGWEGEKVQGLTHTHTETICFIEGWQLPFHRKDEIWGKHLISQGKEICACIKGFYFVLCVLVCSPNFGLRAKEGLFGTALLPSLIFRPSLTAGWGGRNLEVKSAQNVKPRQDLAIQGDERNGPWKLQPDLENKEKSEKYYLLWFFWWMQIVPSLKARWAGKTGEFETASFPIGSQRKNF